MFRKAVLICMLLTSAVLAGTALAAGDPSLHEVYQAAEAGRLNDALGMMSQVLRDHPNSGKAHFVEAELLAKQGRLSNAASELQTAERLAPGLPFANAQAVDSLRRHISSSSSSARMIPSGFGTQSSPASRFPLGLLLMGAALIAAIIFFVRKMIQPRANVMQAAGGPGFANGNGFGSGAPMQPGGAGGGMGMAPMGQAAGGMGSGILGGLATGAVLGAGMVAGEALMHRFTDGGRQHDTGQSFIPASYDRDSSAGDLGGNDFGVSDGGSWDDSSSGGGGDDWT
jgi:hypothetical protein